MKSYEECLKEMRKTELINLFQDSKTIKRLHNIKSPFRRKLLKALYAPIAVIKNENGIGSATIKYFTNKNKVYIPYFEMCITTRCTLRCKYCSNLMPLYEEPADISLDILKSSLGKVLALCDKVDMFQILGGEPFICNNLADVLEFALSFSNIERISIPTNGTVMPEDTHLLELLKNPRVIINLSDYGYGHPTKISRELEEKGINVRCMPEEWTDYGGLENRGRNHEELKRQYRNCSTVCKSLLNGKLFACPRASHGNTLGYCPAKEGDYLNFLDESKAISREELIKFYYRDEPVSACNHCDKGYKEVPRVPAGRDQLPIKKS